ncbi:MAG: zinc ABC transporter substrate-binding protein [Bacteroidota bacterium]
MANRLIILLALALSACSVDNASDKSGHFDRMTIVTTTGIIADLAKNIVGDSADVVALMGPGVDPHLYKATQGDLQKLTAADMIVYNGLHLEGKMGEVLEKLSRIKPVIVIAEGIPPSSRQTVSDLNSYDPHIWFDVKLWRQAAQHLTNELGNHHPGAKAYFTSNFTVYDSTLDALHHWVAERISVIPDERRVLITAHDAFGYFGSAYDIEVKGLQGISTLSEYGLRDVTNLVDYIVDRKIKAVFVETSVSEKAIKAVVQGCQKRGFNVTIGGNLFSDAMGSQGTPEGTYVGMVKSNVNTIVDALK